VARQLTLTWGVVPAFLSEARSARQMMIRVIREGLERGVLDKESNYVLTAGDPPGVPGTTNIIRILRRKELEHFAAIAEEGKLPEDWE